MINQDRDAELALADELNSWADEAQVIIDAGDMPENETRKAKTCVALLREAARATRRDESATREDLARAMFEKAEQGSWIHARTDEQEYWLELADVALVHPVASQGGEAGASVITLATKLLDFIRNEGPSAKEWLPISETADALREAIASSPSPERPAAQPMREALEDSQSLLAMIHHLGTVFDARGITTSDWDNEDLTKLIAEQIDANRPHLVTARANEVKP